MVAILLTEEFPLKSLFYDLVCLSAVLSLSAQHNDIPISPIKKVFIHPPSARRVLLPDGRFLAYKEQGVSADRARFSMIAPHTFLSSRLAGCIGVQDFGKLLC